MITKKLYALMFTAFMLLSLTMVSVPVQSQSPPIFYVAGGTIPGKPAGTTFWVDILVNASDLVYNSPDAIVGWALYVQVNASVLEPLRARTATAGFFLYDFADWEWYPYPSAIVDVDSAAGLVEITEQILPSPLGGAATDDLGGVLPAPYLLVQIEYRSLSLYEDTVIDIMNAEYMDTYQNWHAVVDGDGYYQGAPDIPVEANLVRRKAWAEHHRFVRSRDGDPVVPDSHGTPGVQTLYSLVQNIGDLPITVRALWRLMKDGVVEPMIVSNEVVIEPGEMIVLQADAREFTAADDGAWSVEGKCEYYHPYSLIWITGATTRTSTFNVVP